MTERILVNKNFYIWHDQVEILKNNKNKINASELVRNLLDEYIKKNKLK